MIRLEVFGESGAMDAIARLLDGNDEVSRVRQTTTTQPGYIESRNTIRIQGKDGFCNRIEADHRVV